jgi:hypothetical protein
MHRKYDGQRFALGEGFTIIAVPSGRIVMFAG